MTSPPPGLGPTAVTMGFFDGVHLGHQAVIGRTVEVAKEGPSGGGDHLRQHPREIITPGQEPKLLTTLERKASLIEALGIEALVVLPFTEEFSHWPSDFVHRSPAGSFAAIGANFTFGYKAMGNLAVLSDLGARFGFDVEGVPLVDLDGRRVSSSSVREALAGADLSWPRRALGRRFVLEDVW